MHSWQEDMLGQTAHAIDEDQLRDHLGEIAHQLGFDYWCYGLRHPIPIGKMHIIVRSNYPRAWQRKYAKENYAAIDPSILKGLNSPSALLWQDKVFKHQRIFWQDAQMHGLRYGCTQPCQDAGGVAGALSLVRSKKPLTIEELQSISVFLRLLALTAHNAFARIYRQRHVACMKFNLTDREIDVLRLTALGETSEDIAGKLFISVNTVNFHIKNAVEKLGVSNRTQAAVVASNWGLLCG